MNLGNNNVNGNDEESVTVPVFTVNAAGYAQSNECKASMEDYQSSLVLKKTPTPLSSSLHLEEHEVARTAVSANSSTLINKNSTIMRKECPALPTAASHSLHSPSMTSSPRSAELASSEVSKYNEIVLLSQNSVPPLP
jgi:hypothetical protein